MSDSIADQIALDWIKSIESPTSQVRDLDIYPILKNWVSKNSPRKILELGCGQGACSEHLGLQSQTYVGLDQSQILIDRANERNTLTNKLFIRGDVLNIPYSECIFDAIYSVSVWHLVQDIRKASSELSRTLNRNGKFLIITANPESYDAWKALYFNSEENGIHFKGHTKLKDGSIVHESLYLHTLNEIKEGLENSGLLIESTDTFRSVANVSTPLYLMIQGTKP